jgi:PAS domain S-box-containing protein
MQDDTTMGVFSYFSVIRRIAAIVFSLALAGYMGFLLYSQYRSQIELQEYYLSRLLHDTEKCATAVSYFFSERVDDMNRLAESRELSVYFENQALGMSMQYGLSASLMDAEDAFRKFRENRKLAGNKIFSRVVFLDQTGKKLIDTAENEAVQNGKHKSELHRFVVKKVSTPAFFAEGNDSGSIITLSLPYLFKGRYKGQILAQISPELVYKQFIMESDFRNMRSMVALLYRQRYLFTSEDSKWSISHDQLPAPEILQKKRTYRFVVTDKRNGNRRMNAYVTPIGGIPFSMVTFMPEDEHTLKKYPEMLMIITGGIGVIILIGAFIIIRTTMSNAILSARFVEISIREKAIAEKNRSLRKLTAALEQSSNSVIITDTDGIIEYVNPYFTQLTGYSAAEAIGKNQNILKTETESKESYVKMLRAITSGELWSGELLIRKKNGALYWEYVSLSPVKNDDGEIISCVAIRQDVTERKQAEEKIIKLNAELEQRVLERTAALESSHRELEKAYTDLQSAQSQMLQAQKMEAIGQLAGGIAHDFNNILTAIIGYTELIIIRLEKDAPLRHYVKQILTSAERAAELTNGLLAFSRKQVLHPKPIDLGEVVLGVKKMLRRLIPEDIDFMATVVQKELIVMADKGQIEQVLMNLVTNAKDAMQKGGSLIIEVHPAVMDERFVHAHGDGEPGNYGCLSVTDTGHGMDEKTMKRIFEPFFTTKEIGKGTGLGMAIIYGIVEQHNGYINVYSEAGRGTTFKIYLPLIFGEKKEAQESQKAALPVGGTETILLAEDDLTVRELHRMILEEAGYTIVEAVDGRDALDKFLEHQAKVDMLATDVIMPKIDGKRLCEEIRNIRPDMKVLFMSGYTKDLVMERGILEEESSFLTKPVKSSELLKKVRNILDSH